MASSVFLDTYGWLTLLNADEVRHTQNLTPIGEFLDHPASEW
jgi:hypothetical protein